MLPSIEEINLANMPLPVTDEEIAKMFGEPTDYSQKVIALGKIYIQARKDHEAAEAVEKEKKKQLTSAEGDLHRAMESACCPSVSLDDAGETVKLTKSTKSIYQLPTAWKDDPDFCAWLKLSAPDLVKSSIHAGSFSAHCRELVEKAAEDGMAAGAPSVINPLHQRVQCVEVRGIQLRKG